MKRFLIAIDTRLCLRTVCKPEQLDGALLLFECITASWWLFLIASNILAFIMSICQASRQAIRPAIRQRISTIIPRHSTPRAPRSVRWLSSTSVRASDGSKEDPYRSSSTAAAPSDKEAHEGSFSRTDRGVSFEYPAEQDFPRSQIVQGRGGPHFKRTLPSFSLEDKVAVVTGGARGLGLVMGQALVASGADLALVDLNSESRRRCRTSHSHH